MDIRYDNKADTCFNLKIFLLKDAYISNYEIICDKCKRFYLNFILYVPHLATEVQIKDRYVFYGATRHLTRIRDPYADKL